MKKYLILFILMASQVLMAAPDWAFEKPRHLIVFIHGIGGNDSSFGSMPAALVHHMDEMAPDVAHEAHIFSYPTGNDKLSTDDFALSLGDFIHEKFRNHINSEDRISFVAHSQGGLVATIWYFHASLGKDKYHPEYVKNIDAFVTLGTPFWGSKVASALTKDSAYQGIARAAMEHANVGVKQIEEMALGSKTNINFRKNVLRISQKSYNTMLEHIRPLNIAGMANLKKLVVKEGKGFFNNLLILKPLLYGGKYFESDTLVSIPSARFDSIYSQDLRIEYPENSYDENIEVFKTKFSPFLVVETLHASPMADRIMDLSYLPMNCMKLPACNHPTYQYILDHLLGKKVPEFGAQIPKAELGTFTITFKVDLESWKDANTTKIKIERVFFEENSAAKIIMSPSTEFMTDFEFIHPQKKWIFERHHTGHFDYTKLSGPDYEKARWQGIKAFFRISAPGHKSKIVQTFLKPTYSSFVEVKLSQKLPEMRATPGSRL